MRRADPLPEDLEEYGDRGSLLMARPRPPTRPISRSRPSGAAWSSAPSTSCPADQRAALVLVDMEGYPVAEVAEMLDCAVGTVKSRCSRGRARLAVLLGVLAPRRR